MCRARGTWLARPVAMLLPFPAFCLRFLLAPKRHHARPRPAPCSLPCPAPYPAPCSTGHLAASVTPLSELERARLVRISFWRRRRRRRQRRLWFSLFSLNDFHLFCRWLLLFFSTPAFSFFLPASPARPAASARARAAEAAGVAAAKCNCHKVSLADVVAGVAAAAFVAAVGCGEST